MSVKGGNIKVASCVYCPFLGGRGVSQICNITKEDIQSLDHINDNCPLINQGITVRRDSSARIHKYSFPKDIIKKVNERIKEKLGGTDGK